MHAAAHRGASTTLLILILAAAGVAAGSAATYTYKEAPHLSLLHGGPAEAVKEAAAINAETGSVVVTVTNLGSATAQSEKVAIYGPGGEFSAPITCGGQPPSPATGFYNIPLPPGQTLTCTASAPGAFTAGTVYVVEAILQYTSTTAEAAIDDVTAT